MGPEGHPWTLRSLRGVVIPLGLKRPFEPFAEACGSSGAFPFVVSVKSLGGFAWLAIRYGSSHSLMCSQLVVCSLLRVIYYTGEDNTPGAGTPGEGYSLSPLWGAVYMGKVRY